MSRLLEVCVETPAGLMAARDGGADRIELCSALALGGLTPSYGLMRFAAKTGLPTRAMIRPHADGFVYDADDLDLMLADIDAARDAGLDGVVIGALTPAGHLDVDLLDRLLRHAAGLKTTLHRAVDLLDDPLMAVDFAADRGMDAILTSGGAQSAPLGLTTILAMHEAAAGHVQIMAGAGVTAANVAPLLAGGVSALHASCSRPAPTTDDRAAAFGFIARAPRQTDRDLVRALRASVDAADKDPIS